MNKTETKSGVLLKHHLKALKLSALAQSSLSRSVTQGGLFVFLSRCRSRVKILYWDRDGYALWYK